ncbi:thioredoxin-like protein 1 [Lineus longissimus]|uniref:thioredoxin-like protein 1 n=1 Tax=Lineus longissimus TaxID=88925 RepID=UPI002B4E8DF4
MAGAASNVKELKPEESLDDELTNAGNKLVVVDFYAPWCGPCNTIAPKFAQLSITYPQVVFLKLDVEKCEAAAAKHSIRAMPTFLFFRTSNKVDEQRGADAAALEGKIKKWMVDEEEDDGVGVKGHRDVNNLILSAGCECLNESDDHMMKDALSTKEDEYLESDCDEELICHLAFQQPMRIHSLRFKAPTDQGPKNVKIFINQPTTLDFDSARSTQPTQAIEMKKEELDGTVIGLAYVKFQNVQSMTLFFADNQDGEETTRINYLGIIGTPVIATNMSEFKRVAGKKGESH